MKIITKLLDKATRKAVESKFEKGDYKVAVTQGRDNFVIDILKKEKHLIRWYFDGVKSTIDVHGGITILSEVFDAIKSFDYPIEGLTIAFLDKTLSLVNKNSSWEIRTPQNNIIPMNIDASSYFLDFALDELKRWKCSDPSQGQDQWVRKISKTVFDVFEQGQVITVAIKQYTDEQIKEYTSAYYDSVEEIREQYGEEANQIIAECIAEQIA